MKNVNIPVRLYYKNFFFLIVLERRLRKLWSSFSYAAGVARRSFEVTMEFTHRKILCRYYKKSRRKLL